MIKRLILMCIVLAIALAAQSTRPVNLSWTASTSSGVIGYNIYRSTSVFTTTAGLTPLNSSPITGLSYQDTTAVIGQTYTYGATAVAAACTPTTPVGTPCGQSPLSPTVTTTIPAQPAVSISIVVAVP